MTTPGLDYGSSQRKSLPYDKYASTTLPVSRVVKEWIKRHRVNLISFGLLLLFIFGGAAVFYKFEGVDTNFRVTPVYPCNQSVTEPLFWDYRNSLYFVVITLTTIGYGDMYPVTTPGRVFVCFFIIFGLPVVGYSINVIPSFVASVLKGLARRVLRRQGSFGWLTPVRQLVLGLFFVVVYALIGAGALCAFEGWNYATGVYFVVITLSAVGFGDVHPCTVDGRSFSAVFALFGVGYILFLVSLSIKILVQNEQARRVRKITMMTSALAGELQAPLIGAGSAGGDIGLVRTTGGTSDGFLLSNV